MARHQAEDQVLRYYYYYTMPSIDRITMSIVRPVVEDAHFKIKPAIIQMIQNTLQFYGMTHEDPNQHITIFLEIYDTFKQMGVDHDDTIQGYFCFH